MLISDIVMGYYFLQLKKKNQQLLRQFVSVASIIRTTLLSVLAMHTDVITYAADTPTGFILQYYKHLLPEFNIFPSASTVLRNIHLGACLYTKLSYSERIIHTLSHCVRPEVLAAVSTKISRLRYDTTLYDKNLHSFETSIHLYHITRCHIPKDGNF
jgi:hypothetical protein